MKQLPPAAQYQHQVRRMAATALHLLSIKRRSMDPRGVKSSAGAPALLRPLAGARASASSFLLHEADLADLEEVSYLKVDATIKAGPQSLSEALLPTATQVSVFVLLYSSSRYKSTNTDT